MNDDYVNSFFFIHEGVVAPGADVFISSNYSRPELERNNAPNLFWISSVFRTILFSLFALKPWIHDK